VESFYAFGPQWVGRDFNREEKKRKERERERERETERERERKGNTTIENCLRDN